MTGQTQYKTANNRRFAKAGFSCFYDSEVLNVHLRSFVLKIHPSAIPEPLAVRL